MQNLSVPARPVASAKAGLTLGFGAAVPQRPWRFALPSAPERTSCVPPAMLQLASPKAQDRCTSWRLLTASPFSGM